MAPKATVTPAAKKATAATAKPKGLQLSAAQWKAYTAAYNATANAGFTKLAIQSSAAGLRKYRLGAAYALGKKVAVAHAAARAAAIARFAVSQSLRQSRLAHQNAALQQRVFADYERHVQAAARLQFAYRGEKVYLHTAVMNTLTTAQAVTIETAAYAKAAKAAKAATASTTATAASTAKPSAAVSRITAAATAAGLAAAKATPAGRTAPQTASAFPVGRELSGKFGDPEGYDCVAAAVANHLLSRTGHRLTRRQYQQLAEAIGYGPSIEEALDLVKHTPPWQHGVPQLADFAPVPTRARSHTVIGFATEKGLHAAYCPGPAYVVSWRDCFFLRDLMLPGTDVEEAWALLWA